MKSIAVLITIGLIVLGCGSPPKISRAPVDTTTQAVVTCKKFSQFMPGFCIDFGFTNPPSGFADCGTDTNTYDGEITFHAYINFGEECIWAHPATGTCVAFPTMNDWDAAGNHLGAFQVISRVHSTATVPGAVYSQPNYQGSSQVFAVGPFGQPFWNTYNEPWHIQSGYACNAY